VLKHAIAVLLLAAISNGANAATIGDKACADAEVIASIKSQTWKHLVSNDPQYVIMDVLLHITLDVERVEYGSISPGTVTITTVAHTLIDASRKHMRFFLKRARNANWEIATCRSH
jgi:hypothetical protein